MMLLLSFFFYLFWLVGAGCFPPWVVWSYVFFGRFLFGMGFGLKHFSSNSVSDVDDPHSSLPSFSFQFFGPFSCVLLWANCYIHLFPVKFRWFSLVETMGCHVIFLPFLVFPFDFFSRIFPVVVSDEGCCFPDGSFQYRAHWEVFLSILHFLVYDSFRSLHSGIHSFISLTDGYWVLFSHGSFGCAIFSLRRFFFSSGGVVSVIFRFFPSLVIFALSFLLIDVYWVLFPHGSFGCVGFSSRRFIPSAIVNFFLFFLFPRKMSRLSVLVLVLVSSVVFGSSSSSSIYKKKREVF